MAEPWDELVAILRRGGVIACATETLFGLLADARSERAVARVVELKQRGPEPIALLAPDLASVESIAEPLSVRARELAERYWPGPLTLILRALPGLPSAIVRAGTVGIRIPGASPALELVRAFAGPLTATSCNPSGSPAARSDIEARAYFGDRVDAIVSGEAAGAAPSTIVDASGAEMRVLRRGAIDLELD